MSRHHLAILLLITLCSLSPARARYVDDADDQVVYSGLALSARSLACKLNAAKCTSNWWLERSSRHHNGSLHVTHGPVAFASFSFQGSALALIGSAFAHGAKALIAVDDGAPQIVDFTSPTGARVDGVRLYARSGLDPAVTHTVVLSYDSTSYVPRRDEPRYMAVDAFLVEDGPDAPAVTHPPSPATLSSRAISSSSGTVLARDDDIPTSSSGSSPTFNDLYADSDETHTSSSPAASSSQWSPVGHSQPASLNAGQIAAIGVVSGVLFVALAFAVLWCVKAKVCYGPRRVRQSSRRGESVLSWSFGSVMGNRGGRQAAAPPRQVDTRAVTAPAAAAASGRAASGRRNIARASLEAQRSPSPPPELLTPVSPSPISPANSLTPLALPRRAASTTAGSGPSSSRRGPPAPLPLGSSSSLHPHAVPTPMASPRLAEWAQHVVIPPSPAPTAAPPPYTPRSRPARSPRNLQELREKMSPFTA